VSFSTYFDGKVDTAVPQDLLTQEGKAELHANEVPKHVVHKEVVGEPIYKIKDTSAPIEVEGDIVSRVLATER
jgi:hypothetical protein